MSIRPGQMKLGRNAVEGKAHGLAVSPHTQFIPAHRNIAGMSWKSKLPGTSNMHVDSFITEQYGTDGEIGVIRQNLFPYY